MKIYSPDQIKINQKKYKRFSKFTRITAPLMLFLYSFSIIGMSAQKSSYLGYLFQKVTFDQCLDTCMIAGFIWFISFLIGNYYASFEKLDKNEIYFKSISDIIKNLKEIGCNSDATGVQAQKLLKEFEQTYKAQKETLVLKNFFDFYTTASNIKNFDKKRLDLTDTKLFD